MLVIRKAETYDFPEICLIYEGARRFMALHGNPNQWGATHPPESLLREDIDYRRLYVTQGEEGLLAAFAFLPGEDPTYRVIRDGAWLNDAPYWVIHRIASSGKRRGAAREAMLWAFRQHDNIRIDTHEDNLPMQKALAECGFIRCGIIRLASGDPRVAYQRIR